MNLVTTLGDFTLLDDRQKAFMIMSMFLAIGINHQGGELLQRAGASEVVIAEDLIASELVNRLGCKGKPDR